MEELLGDLLECIIEVVVEFIGMIITKYVNLLDRDKQARKVSKFVMILVFYSVSILIFTLSIIYKKAFLVNITLIYMLIQTVFNALRFINKNALQKEGFEKLIKTIKIIFYYSYPVILILTSALWITDGSTKAWIIVFSSLAILIRFIIDMTAVEKYAKRKNNKQLTDEIILYWEEKKAKFLNTYDLPKEILSFIETNNCLKFELKSEFSRSGDRVYNIDDKYILKISTNKELLLKEKNINELLKDYKYFSKPILFCYDHNYTYYLRTIVSGKPLCSQEYLDNPKLVVSLLAEAIQIIHAIRINKPNENKSDVFVHGDCCLPNILIENNEVSGFIDLGDAGYGDPWIDYSWALWSLSYNLQTDKYNQLLLDELGIKMDQKKYEKYIIY